ncbi:MAG: hypothetical protein ACRCT8_11305 [Lacipirellulaceae bacterium]
MLRALTCVFSLALASAAPAQTVVYSNQQVIGTSSLSAFTSSAEWDDLVLEGGGRLSELSLLTRRSDGSRFASGTFDVRLFNETGNFPQGQSLGVIPFSGEFPAASVGSFTGGVNVKLVGLESLGIDLPVDGKIGIGVQFNQSGWALISSGPAGTGASPGGNWLGTSPTERSEFTALPYELKVIPPAPVGPGVGSYTLFETALPTPNDPTTNGGMGATSSFYSGVNFSVERPTKVSEIGVHAWGTGTMFGAIVRTSGLFATPNLSGPDVVATTLLSLPATFGGAEVRGAVDATLEPGTYALIFGTGAFGASGDAVIRDEHVANGDWYPYAVRLSDGLRIGQAGTFRMLAVADSAPGTFQARPAFDAVAEVTSLFNGSSVSVRVVDGEEGVTVDADTPNSDTDQRAVLEFLLDPAIASRGVTSATLELNLRLLTGAASVPVAFDVYGYPGDGVLRANDADQLAERVGTTSFGGIGSQTLTIDRGYVQELVDAGASHLGLVIVPSGTANFRFSTLESGAFDEPPLLTLTLGPPVTLTGDYNGDGAVNAADYTSWRDTLGQTGAGLAADGDGDGVVGPGDYTVWANRYGAAAASHSIPEPGAGVLVGAGATLLSRRRRVSPRGSATTGPGAYCRERQ